MTHKTVDVLLGDSPESWEGWPFSRNLEARVTTRHPDTLLGADRVELLVRRVGVKDSEEFQLTGYLVALAKDDDESIAIIEGDLLNDAHDMSSLYFAVPTDCINRVISVLANEKGLT